VKIDKEVANFSNFAGIHKRDQENPDGINRVLGGTGAGLRIGGVMTHNHDGQQAQGKGRQRFLQRISQLKSFRFRLSPPVSARSLRHSLALFTFHLPLTIASRLLCLVLLVCGVVCTAHAQSETATISGLVTDGTGAVIVGAEVNLLSVAQGTAQKTTTNNSGIYVFPSVHPGQYQIRVHKPGFKQVDLLGLIVNVQDHVEQNFGLQVGSVSESVTVSASDLRMNTTDATVSTVIDHVFVESLPLNGRTFNTLVQLTPGAVIAPSSNVSQGQFSIEGQRTSSNNFLVDGVSANFGVASLAGLGTSGTGSAQAFSVLGGTNSLVSVEALQEFRIETSSFAPEFGRTPGGQVSLTTRAGTNALHGAVYEYFRNEDLDANDWFNNAATPQIPRAPERHNDFGGALGGPIWKDKTFFFASYEGARLKQPATSLITVPYTAVSPCLAPAPIAPFLNAYPKPNGPVSTSTCTGQFTSSASNPVTLDAGSIRIDHNFNDRFHIFGRYNEAPSTELPQIANSVTEEEVGTRTLTLGTTIVINQQIFNTVRGNYSLQKASSGSFLDSLGGAVPPSFDILAPKLSNPSSGAIGFGPFDGTAPYSIGPFGNNRSTQLNFADDLNLTHGSHQLKFGGDYRAIYTNARAQDFALQYFVSSIPNFLATQSADFGILVSNNKPSYFLAQSFSLYGQDTWKATTRLAVTYGFRWELNPAPTGRRGAELPAWDNINNPSQLALAPAGTELWKTTYINFGPRVGIAYTLTPKGDLVLRAGGGIFYDLASDAVGDIAHDFPNGAFSFAPPAVLPLADARPLIPALSSQPPYPFTTQGYVRNLKLPRSYQWNIALEKSFGEKQSVSITYVGQAGRDLLRQEGIIPPNPPNTRFPAGDVFLLTQNSAYSNFDALQVQYRRPLSSGLQALLNYTWSHSLDNASNDTIEAVSGTIVSASAAKDYASSDNDVRHNFSGALTYAIPAAAKSGMLGHLTGGWSLGTIIVARSGFPFNARLEGFTIAGANLRPDLVTGKPVWIQDPTAGGGKSLNPEAFATPPAGHQGTEGRNDIPGFGLTQIDLSLGRKFIFTERLSLQFRADAFNVLNHPNFANPLAFYFGPGNTSFLHSRAMLNNGLNLGGGLNPLFQQGGPRSLQLSLKLNF
jgi:hypothetical protein